MAFVDSSRSVSEYSDNHIDYTNLGPRYRKQLEYAFLKAGADERKRCVESLNDIGETRTKRPYTAMPILEHTTGEDGFSSQYSTSYKNDYYPKKYPTTKATRPMSTGISAVASDTCMPNTHYDREYFLKTPNTNHVYRSGSASGTRNNKPHPSKEFLIWKFPTTGHSKRQPRDLVKERVTDAKLNEIHRRLCRSTYQSDYLGMPQGYHIVSNDTEVPDAPAYDIQSYQRSTFRTPMQPDCLKLATTRYGSNNNKFDVAYGTIPLANVNINYGSKMTTYDKHYNHHAGDGRHFNEFLNRHGMNGRGYNTHVPLSPDSLVSSGGSRKYQAIVPPATSITCYSPPQPVAY